MQQCNQSRTCAITGPTHGIGKVIARDLAAQGFNLILLCRDVTLGQALQASLPAGSEIIACDLADPNSVAQAARQILSRHSALHVLINNAGILEMRKRLIGGVDAMMAVNHLGHYLLTRLLLPRLQQTPQSRIVITSSQVHQFAQLARADPLGLQDASTGLQAYSRSKLANLCFALMLARRLEGSDTCCNALHPGIILSNLMRHSGGWVQPLAPLMRPFARTETQGAQTSIYLASDPRAAHLNGQYLNARAQIRSPSARARDSALQQALWLASEQAMAPQLAS